jgi:two-component system capsular synthesis sensor histidine kinase RcsC
LDFDVREVARSLIAQVEPLRGQKPVALHWAATDPVPRQVRGDLPALRKALRHLLENAVRFTERGAVKLDIACEPTAGDFALKFTVRDTGHGIPAPARERLFDSFAQDDNPLSRDHEGLSLGLATTKRLVERMRGAITVESAPGQGSAFSITIPFTAPASAPLLAAAND